MAAFLRTPRSGLRAVLCGVLLAAFAPDLLRAQAVGRPNQKGPERPTQEVQQTLARIQTLTLQNRFLEAAHLGEQLVKEHRDSLEAWLALASVHLSPEWTMRRDARAESASRKALQLGGHRPDIVQALATALYRQRKYDECAPLLDELIESKPQRVTGEDYADLLYLRASIGLRRDALDAAAHARALADLERALATAPSYAPARRLRAEALFGDGKLAEALADLEVAVVTAPGDKGIHYQMQLCLTRLKRPDEAKRHYEIWKLINALTDSTATVNAPDRDERRRILVQLKELNPADFTRRLQLAEIELAVGEADAAIRECDEVLTRRPGWAAAEHLRAEGLRAKAGAKPDLPSAHGDDGGGGA